MALVVEDGTGKADAASYATVAAFKAHCDARGIEYGDDTEIEQSLRKATDYLGQTYGQRLSGYRVSATQALDFPRYDVPRRDLGSEAYYVSNAIPAVVVAACIEAAVRAAAGPLTPDLGQSIAAVKAGSVELTYADYSTATKTYPALDRLMAPLLANGGGGRMVRA
jgi:hypothetical protein